MSLNSYAHFSALRIEHLGREDERLSEQLIFRSKPVFISALAQKMTLNGQQNAESVQFQKTKNEFYLSIPSLFKIEVHGGETIWPGGERGPKNVSFCWDTVPSNLQVILPNQNKIKISPQKVSVFGAQSPLKISAPLLGALTFHMVAIALVTLTPSTPERPLLKIPVELLQTRALSSPSRVDAAKDDQGTVARLNATKKLLSGLKIKNSMNAKTIGSTQLDRAFSQKASAFSKSWSMNEEIEGLKENPLNLTEAEVKLALYPVYSKLKDCYEDVLIRDSTLKGQPQLRVDVNQLGRVSAVNLSYLNAKAGSLQKLKDCFFEAYQIVKLPKPNREFQVVHTLVLN